jgi:dsDNA-specific endonuclease/ATPase MutS2
MGKGIVREVRNNGRLLVDVQGRALVFDASAVRAIDEAPRSRSHKTRRGNSDARAAVAAGATQTAVAALARPREVDLHGLTVDAAMARVEATLDACVRDDVGELRVIHGRSGGRLRAALHQRLARITTVRRFRLDQHNPGVTVVVL